MLFQGSFSALEVSCSFDFQAQQVRLGSFDLITDGLRAVYFVWICESVGGTKPDRAEDSASEAGLQDLGMHINVVVQQGNEFP